MSFYQSNGWKALGFVVLLLSFLIALSGGLYAGNRFPMTTNIAGTVELLSSPKGSAYVYHLFVAFLLLAVGSYMLSWNKCEHFSDFETGAVYSKPAPLLMNETFSGGVGRLNQAGQKSVKTEGGGSM
jgi:hypothetical protein